MVDVESRKHLERQKEKDLHGNDMGETRPTMETIVQIHVSAQGVWTPGSGGGQGQDRFNLGTHTFQRPPVFPPGATERNRISLKTYLAVFSCLEAHKDAIVSHLRRTEGKLSCCHNPTNVLTE